MEYNMLPIISLFALLAFYIQYLVNFKVKERYIDEYFHLSMTEQYLVYNNFTHWDPKITTPPGLYLLGYLYGIIFQTVNHVFTGEHFNFNGENVITLRYLNR